MTFGDIFTESLKFYIAINNKVIVKFQNSNIYVMF